MPAYELSLVFKTLARSDLSAALKRIGLLLLNRKTVLQKIENHGARDLPHRITKEDIIHEKGSFFVYYFISSEFSFPEIKEECSRDVDIIRFGIVNQHEEFKQGCTLDGELKCPAYRESVQKLMEEGRVYKEKTKIRYKHVHEYEYFDKYM